MYGLHERKVLIDDQLKSIYLFGVKFSNIYWTALKTHKNSGVFKTRDVICCITLLKVCFCICLSPIVYGGYR